jgi:hypothetical protein
MTYLNEAANFALFVDTNMQHAILLYAGLISNDCLPVIASYSSTRTNVALLTDLDVTYYSCVFVDVG